MIRKMLASSRQLVLIAVLSIFAASMALLVYEAIVVASTLVRAIAEGQTSPKASKALAAGLIEAIDVFLIAVVAYITSLGLYALFVDETLPLPRWLVVRDLEDLKGHLLSVIIAVLAVLFLQEIVERAHELDLLRLAAAIALMIGALTLFLGIKTGTKP